MPIAKFRRNSDISSKAVKRCKVHLWLRRSKWRKKLQILNINLEWQSIYTTMNACQAWEPFQTLLLKFANQCQFRTTETGSICLLLLLLQIAKILNKSLGRFLLYVSEYTDNTRMSMFPVRRLADDSGRNNVEMSFVFLANLRIVGAGQALSSHQSVLSNESRSKRSWLNVCLIVSEYRLLHCSIRFANCEFATVN